VIRVETDRGAGRRGRGVTYDLTHTVKLAVLPFAAGPVFSSAAARGSPGDRR